MYADLLELQVLADKTTKKYLILFHKMLILMEFRTEQSSFEVIILNKHPCKTHTRLKYIININIINSIFCKIIYEVCEQLL